MVQITSVHLVGEDSHEHIQSVTWVNPANEEKGTTNLQAMITWLRGGGEATVSVGGRTEQVQVVEGDSPHIQAFSGGVSTNSLLALPRY
jgi:hypothetical protein